MYIGAYRYTNHIPMTADAPRSKLWYPAQNSDSPPQFRLSCSIAQWPKTIDIQKFRNENMYIAAYRYTIHILMTADAP